MSDQRQLRNAHNAQATGVPPVIVLSGPEGSAELEGSGPGRYRVTLKPNDPSLYIPLRSCETSLPLEIVKDFFHKAYPWLCDFLSRQDEGGYVMKVIGRQLLAYLDVSEFRGKRFLDFGCGTGASTLGMAALLPETEFIGVELSEGALEWARKVAAARNLPNVRFLISPDGNSLPAGIGSFDFVMFSAVYEHLLPEERPRVMPLIWSAMKPGGVLFINQTPYRYFPYEHHSTGLWFINYLPDGVSFWLAKRFPRINIVENQSRHGEGHLRGGLRGGTEREILRNLRLAGNGEPVIMQPKNGDRAAYWLSCTNPERHRVLKNLIASGFRLTDKLLGTIPSMNLDVVIRKG